jgi:hypothetical protein
MLLSKYQLFAPKQRFVKTGSQPLKACFPQILKIAFFTPAGIAGQKRQNEKTLFFPVCIGRRCIAFFERLPQK